MSSQGTIGTSDQTFDATPYLMYSQVLDTSKQIRFTVEYLVYKTTDLLYSSSGEITAVFSRQSGSLQRTSANDDIALHGSIQGNLTTPSPTISLIANTSTNEIELWLNGLASTTLTWNILARYYQN